MDRYISIDNAIKIVTKAMEGGEYHRLIDVSNALKEATVADVVEVVRCKDCEHWGGVAYGFVCRKFSGMETKICMGADHFCSYGERKESDGSEGH
jgi:hypothetical protein